MKLFRILDPFTATLITVVLLASFFPARGAFVPFFEHLTTAAIALLFFMHGAKLSGGDYRRRQPLAFASLGDVQHLYSLPATRGSVCLVGAGECRSDALQRLYLSVHSAGHRAIRYRLYFAGRGQRRGCGLLSLGLQPAGDLCFPLLVGVLMNLHGAGGSLEQVGKIMLQLLLPFVLGHLSRPWIGDWVAKHKKWIGKTDQTSILLVVYSAFSEAVVNGIWHKVGLGSLLFIVVVSLVLLAIVIAVNVFVARRCGFNKADEITIVFCGSKKSTANGIPMANILFPTSILGIMVLPLMIFHQIQLMVCAVLARRYKQQTDARLAEERPTRPKPNALSSGAGPDRSAPQF